MAWLYLLLAGLFEVGWAIGLKYTEGFSRLLPSLLAIAAMALSLALLGLALRDLPVGTGRTPSGPESVLSALRHLAFTFSASQRRLCALAALD